MNKTTLVLGASDKVWSYAFQAITRLRSKGIQVYGIGKKGVEISGIQMIDKEYKLPVIHTVTMYLNANNQKEYYEYLIELNPKRVLFNPGSENTELEQVLNERAIQTERACTLVLLGTGQY